MRIDPGVAFDNMMDRGATGTTGWTKYEVTLELNPEETEQIVIGGLLVGKGKMWLDHLSVTIDAPGKEVPKPVEKELLPADKDIEFDEGSGIANIPTDPAQIENLKTLGLIWGFVKYHHPAISSGEYNMDAELFRILPDYLKVANNDQRDALLVNWIERFGEFSAGEELRMDTATTKVMPDLAWITESNFSEQLTSLLLALKKADRPDAHYYIGMAPGVGNPQFKNEKTYESMKYPDAGFRLLTVYKYWNIIQYFFPYKHLIEGDWKEVLEAYILVFCKVKDETAYTLAAVELIGQIHDTHANVWGGNQILNRYKGERYAAPTLIFAEGQPVVTGFHNDTLGTETGLTIGDVISAVNDQPVTEMVRARLKYAPASNFPTKLRDIASSLLRTNDSTINITYLRDSEVRQTSLKTYSSEEMKLTHRFYATDTSFRMIDDKIAYLNNSALKTNHLPIVWEHIKETKGLIIDNRNYPTDFPLFDLTKYLMPESTPFVKFTGGSIENPGLFTFADLTSVGTDNTDSYQGEVVILVNEVTQSSAEYHSMAYRVHPNATVIGSTTAAADGNISPFYLPGGISTMISGIGVYYPDGTETQRIGIVPDIESRPTIAGIKAGRDEVLEKAIEFINKK